MTLALPNPNFSLFVRAVHGFKLVLSKLWLFRYRICFVLYNQYWWHSLHDRPLRCSD
jgi:hypothetical protein